MPNKPKYGRIEVVYTSASHTKNLVGQHRWFDPTDGALYGTQYSSAPVAYGFRGSAFDANMLHSDFASVRVLSKPAARPVCNCSCCAGKRPHQFSKPEDVPLQAHQPTPRIPGYYTSQSFSSIREVRYLDPTTGVLYDDTGERMNSGFKRRGIKWVNGTTVFTPGNALPVKRYAVQLGDGTGNGAGNSLRHFSDRAAAVQNAKEKATAYPGKAVKLLELTEVETFLLTTTTTKSWE